MPIIIGLSMAAIIVLFFRTRRKKGWPFGSATIEATSLATLVTKKPNDKIVVVQDVSINDLRKVLRDFCELYNQDSLQAQLSLINLTSETFVITFPFDIDFEIYCYFINYLVYPIEHNWTADVTGWTTTKSSDAWITGRSANKKVMLFVPPDDTEHDNVYMTTQDNRVYKLSFSSVEKEQVLNTPRKWYAAPEVDLSSLSQTEAEEFS